MKNRKIWRGIFLSFLVILFAGNALAAEFTLKFQSSYSTKSKTWPTVTLYADKLEELSKGRIKVNRYPSAQLVATKEALTGLRRGAIDILLSAGSYYPGFIPVADVFFLPTIFKGADDVLNRYNNTDLGKIIKKAHLKYGVVHVAPIVGGPEVFMMRKGKELKTLADLQGLLIRGPGGVANRLVDKLGGKSVYLSTGELYTALQRGTVDGVIYPTYLLVPLKFIEVTNSIVMNPMFIDPLVVDIYMSKRTYDRLPADLQKSVDDAGLFVQRAATEIFEKATIQTLRVIKEKGFMKNTWPQKDLAVVNDKAVEILDEWAKKSADNAAIVKILKSK